MGKEELNAVAVLLEIYQIDKYPSESRYLRLSHLCKLRGHQDHSILREVILQVCRRQRWCFNPELFELATRLAHQVKSSEKEIFYTSLLLRCVCSPGEQGIETAKVRAQWTANAQGISPKFEPTLPRTILH